MNEKLLTDAMGELEDRYVEEALSYQKKKRRAPVWVKWGTAAACVCLLAVGILTRLPGLLSDSLGGTVGGDDTIGPTSIAVYPATEQAEEVADATVEDQTEAEAYSVDPLGAYLPTSLPDGICYEAGSLYETTMQDGAKYYRLRVVYASPEDDTQNEITDEWGNPVEGVDLASGFIVSVSSFRPKTEDMIYAPREVTKELLEERRQNGKDAISIDFGEIFVRVEQTDLEGTLDDFLLVVNSIRENVT